VRPVHDQEAQAALAQVVADRQPGLTAADHDDVEAFANGQVLQAAEAPERLPRFDERLDARC
jgi:hypothetical protein